MINFFRPGFGTTVGRDDDGGGTRITAVAGIGDMGGIHTAPHNQNFKRPPSSSRTCASVIVSQTLLLLIIP